MPREMIVLPAMIACLLTVSCKNADSKRESDTTAITKQAVAPATGDNTRNSIDWAGTYKGTTPCADCDGIETSLQLNRDNTYLLTTQNLSKGNKIVQNEIIQETKGKFSWDTSGSVITLQGLKGSPTQYKVGEDMVIQYDLQGKEVTGDLADKYILRK